MEYREFRAPSWSPVERIWIARGAGGAPETILPDGRFELIFNLADPVLQDGASQPRAMLAAETRRAVSIASTGRIEFVGVRLRDAAVGQVLGCPPRLLRDRMIDLHALAPALDLSERLAEADDERRVATILGAFGAHERHPLAANAAALIRRSGGRLSISRLASAYGVSIRTLSRAFDRALGLTPKTLARVMRLGRAAAWLREGEVAADVALRAGFADQSHMTHEFRAIARLSPSRWLELPPGLGVQFLQDPAGPAA
ncbi:MAG TPA: helix-turn-helix transcriptional regulator [Thermoanaerobaculia bacterium]|nr:helix-turn-helix transcriptional regulator [Thermoanaerobaculia bacterium]